jgi:hypothetical protein
MKAISPITTIAPIIIAVVVFITIVFIAKCTVNCFCQQ